MAKKRKTGAASAHVAQAAAERAAARAAALEAANRRAALNGRVRDRVGVTVTAFAAALVLMVGLGFNDGYPGLVPTADGTASQVVVWLVSIVATFVALVGVFALVLTVQTTAKRWGVRGVAFTLGATVVMGLLAAMFIALPHMLIMLSAPGMAILVLALIMATPTEFHSPAWDRGTKTTVAAGFALAATVAVVLGGLDILVWNPLASANGESLGEVYEAIAASDPGPGFAPVIGWAAFWLVAAVVVVLLAAARSDRVTELLPDRRLLVTGLLLVTGPLAFHAIAGVSMQLWLLDTYEPASAIRSPVTDLFSLLAQLGLIACFAAALLPWGRLRTVMSIHDAD